jgi:hypothetical protein
MTRGLVSTLLLFSAVALAQEPTTTPTPTATASATIAATPTATPSPTASRSIRISFLPPPLEGKISLGIYDGNDQLVRVLHQEADLDEFTTGADALVTKWDGKDDFGYDLWPGKYHARGFLVAPMKIEEITTAETETPAQSVKIKLMANPLEQNERPTVQITVGTDDEDVVLKTADGLPLLTITQATDIKTVAMTAGRENKLIVVRVEAGTGTRRFSISGLSKMMAFDCGEFALK